MKSKLSLNATYAIVSYVTTNIQFPTEIAIGPNYNYQIDLIQEQIYADERE